MYDMLQVIAHRTIKSRVNCSQSSSSVAYQLILHQLMLYKSTKEEEYFHVQGHLYRHGLSGIQAGCSSRFSCKKYSNPRGWNGKGYSLAKFCLFFCYNFIIFNQTSITISVEHAVMLVIFAFKKICPKNNSWVIISLAFGFGV